MKLAPFVVSIVALAATVLVAGQEPLTWTAQQDHQNMMDQLGIKTLRPGPNGRAAAGEPGAANYDAAKANPYPDLPDPLRLKDGRKVTTAAQWRDARRPEIVEDFEREVVGRVPKNVPQISWRVAQTVNTTIGGTPVVARQLVGHADNTSCPAITVDIQMAVVTPAKITQPIPLLMMFSNGAMPAAPEPMIDPNAPLSSPRQLIAKGWGYASINTTSIQADNGAGLTRGIIGLTNKGQARKPDDWGALRAWAWGASRSLDYLLTDPSIDAKHIGIEGVSRYGKAALVAAAFDSRFQMVLVGSSGEGGAKLHRRNFGEAVENLTGTGEYHWMAGNFLKYGASDATFGSKTAGDLPVDSHELIALVAPRWVFISYGIPEKGDANWLDHQGSYMAAVAAGPVFRLLGVRDLGDTRDYHVATMPGVNVGVVNGELAWRQHDGGHEDRSNMTHFIEWADRLMTRRP
jgi:(4-O-methyl)-D-glucuronate---lignin esterase